MLGLTGAPRGRSWDSEGWGSGMVACGEEGEGPEAENGGGGRSAGPAWDPPSQREKTHEPDVRSTQRGAPSPGGWAVAVVLQRLPRLAPGFAGSPRSRSGRGSVQAAALLQVANIHLRRRSEEPRWRRARRCERVRGRRAGLASHRAASEVYDSPGRSTFVARGALIDALFYTAAHDTSELGTWAKKA